MSTKALILYTCSDCNQELLSDVPPRRPCRCGARGKWANLENKLLATVPETLFEALKLDRLTGEEQTRLMFQVKDFLAHNFCHAALSNPDCELVLDKLFRACTRVVK